MGDDFLKCREAAVVRVGGGEGYVSEGWGGEFVAVGGVSCEGFQTYVIRSS